MSLLSGLNPTRCMIDTSGWENNRSCPCRPSRGDCRNIVQSDIRARKIGFCHLFIGYIEAGRDKISKGN